MNTRKLKFREENQQYIGIIGTGGIGSGKFFQLNGCHTLGREESRSGHFLDANDYSKQHIILHYCKVLLGPSFLVVPVGRIGDDDVGNNLLNEMTSTGFIMDHVEKLSHTSTLFSFCFYYPDGTGGNLTTDNSASGLVDSVFIENALDKIINLGSKGIIMAAPEVPLKARQRLLEIGKKHKLFCTASFTSGEIQNVLDTGILANVDLLAINIDEASAITGSSYEGKDVTLLIQNAVHMLQNHNTDIKVSITAGNKGSWCWDGKVLNAFPSVKTEVKSTAGAGDAFFSGLLCGTALGLHLTESQQLATLIAGMSVQSRHTIHKGIDRTSLNMFMRTSGLTFSEKIINLLED
jgi:ribokinase